MASNMADIPSELLTDFDIVADPLLHRDPQQRLREVFGDEPREILYSPHNGGHWIITRHTLAHEILCDAKRFGSFPIGVPANFAQRPRLIPLESDVDEHRRYRRLLLPIFEPRAVRAMEEGVRERTQKVLDNALRHGEIDFLSEIAKPIPTQLFARQMGLNESDLEQFYIWEKGFYRAPTEAERVACGEHIAMHLHQTVQAHKVEPQNDIVSLLLAAEVDGEKLSDDEVDAICFLLFLAGIDTVASMLSFIVFYLARNPDLWLKLRMDAALLDRSVDEFLRMHAFINLNRIVSEDVEFHGVQFRAGDNVVIPSFVTDHDASVFSHPDTFNPDRSATERNRHHAFGAGAHKCLGLHLAKLEVKVVLEELARRVVSMEIKDPSNVSGHGGTTMGLDTLPVHFTLG